ncbi:MAG: hypothetical protein ACK4S0_02825 [Sediminibacterium sp.]|nr:hypothetical protein [uncultured Sediminibacterium sp.]
MKNSSYQLLVNAAGQLLQQHAFDHLSDEKLSRMNSCLHKLGQQSSNADLRSVETELLNYCREANLYVETATPQSLHQWYAAMSCFGESVMPLVEEVE